MTILESTPIMTYASSLIWMTFIGLILSTIGLTFAKIFDEVGSDSISIIFAIIAVLGCGCFIIGAVCLVVAEPKIDTGRIQYTVKCDDSISLNEFYNKYKILEHTQYTDVYIVEEINNDN